MVRVGADVELFVVDQGTGAPVVLLGGIGSSVEIWQMVAQDLLAAGRRVLRVDLRGAGRSDKPGFGYEVEQLARDLVEVLDARGVAVADVVGWSFGGQVGLALAALANDRVRRLVMVGSNGVRASWSEEFPFGPQAGTALAALVAAEERDSASARRDLIRSGFATEPAPEIVNALVSLSLRTPTEAARMSYCAMLETDLTSALPDVRAAVTIVVGDLDPGHSDLGAKWVAEQLPKGEVVLLTDCGHYPMIEQLDAFSHLLEARLAGSA